MTDEQLQQVKDAILAGRKIEAVKLCREATGKGLKEAKDEVDRITAELKRDHPDLVTESKGCAAVLVFGLVTGLALAGMAVSGWSV